MRSPRFISDLESGDPDVVNFGRKGNLWPGMGGDFEQRRFHDFGPELGVPENMYERHSSPKRDRGAHFRDFSPQKFPRKVQSLMILGTCQKMTWYFTERRN